MTIVIAIISLIFLIIFHELGHFLFAKKFGVRVDEFGIGYPPRVWGKKIGETLYSINLLPLGGFVKIYGHEERIEESDSFTTKPFWQKSIIILAGVAVFWVIAAILLSVVVYIGAPSAISDNEVTGFQDPKVQIISIADSSPASGSNLKVGDIIKSINDQEIDKVYQVQNLVSENKGEEIILTVQRGQKLEDIKITPRLDYPQEEGSMGVGLLRTGLKKTVWYKAPVKGVEATVNLTKAVVGGWIITIKGLVQNGELPAGVEVKGPIGIFELFNNFGGLGVSYFLQFVAVIAISLALINILPIPALDGGWFLFLVIEKIIGRPLNQKWVQNISVFFFFLLILLLIWVTVKDVIGLL